MWSYEKRLEYPVNITTPNAKLASYIISQYGGPDGELSASTRYLSQRFSAYNARVAGLLTDIGREAPEMFHLRGLHLRCVELYKQSGLVLCNHTVHVADIPSQAFPVERSCFERFQHRCNLRIIHLPGCNPAVSGLGRRDRRAALGSFT